MLLRLLHRMEKNANYQFFVKLELNWLPKETGDQRKMEHKQKYLLKYIQTEFKYTSKRSLTIIKLALLQWYRDGSLYIKQ